MEKVCLYDFVQEYDRCGEDKEGVPVYKKRSKPYLPNHRLYDPNKEGQREDYFYSLLLLFVPFRSEAELVKEGETAEQAFSRASSTNSGIHLHHEKLEQMLKAQENVKNINNARQQQGNDTTDDNKSPDVDPCVVGEAKSALDDLQDLQQKPEDKISLSDRIAMLNADQSRVFRRVSDHLHHQHKHETGTCKCTELSALRMFLSGVGGTGKSFIIEAIRAQAHAIWSSQGSKSLICAVAAPTGLAAFNVGGVTLHRLFQLPIEHEGKAAGYWPLAKEVQKFLRTTFRCLKLLIVDEVSMISSLNLAYLHLRLCELFGNDELFGSVNVLFVGDLLQLPPVSGGLVFDRINSKTLLSKLGCMTSINIWEETVVYDELTINERQKDAEFCSLLDEVRRGCVSEKSIGTLRGRVCTSPVVDKFKELECSGQSPVCLFPKRSPCEEFNNAMLASLQSKVVEIVSTDAVDETMSTHKWTPRAQKELEKLNRDSNLTAGLEAVLRIAVRARVMLRRNIDTDRGLVNGALGTVKKIQSHHVTVLFDNTKCECDIEKVKSKFVVMRKFYVYRGQFPLILAYAITIHKCQGLSLDCAIMDLSTNVFSPGMAYVALSRVRTLSGVYLTDFEPDSIRVDPKSVEEINRLRRLFRPDLPALTIAYTSRKRKLTRVNRMAVVQKKLSVPCDTVKSRNGKRKLDENLNIHVQPKKMKTNAIVDADVYIVENHANGGTSHHRSGWRFHPVKSHLQRRLCEHLGLHYHRANRFGYGGPDCLLTLPNLKTVRQIVGDGNCLFRSSLVLCGHRVRRAAHATANSNT